MSPGRLFPASGQTAAHLRGGPGRRWEGWVRRARGQGVWGARLSDSTERNRLGVAIKSGAHHVTSPIPVVSRCRAPLSSCEIRGNLLRSASCVGQAPGGFSVVSAKCIVSRSSGHDYGARPRGTTSAASNSSDGVRGKGDAGVNSRSAAGQDSGPFRPCFIRRSIVRATLWNQASGNWIIGRAAATRWPGAAVKAHSEAQVERTARGLALRHAPPSRMVQRVPPDLLRLRP